MACPGCSTAFAPEQLETARWALHRPAAPAHGDELVGRAFGPWRLLRLLGRGGMGRVYEATDAAGRRRVAVKVLAEDLAADPAFVKRFHREAKVLAALEHPHVVEILDQGESDGRLWFAMEYVRGENLRARLARGPLPPEDATRIAREVASALAYAHAHGVVHRDLKPENVLLDADGAVHLVDFGLSRLAGDGGAAATTMLTRTDVILGTYEYMAPEQRRGEKDVDGRADVFALGVILYEMLTGSLPLGRFAPPSELRDDVPRTFDAVVNRALAPDRESRYVTAEDLADAVGDAWAERDAAASREMETTPKPVPAGDVSLESLRGVLRHVDLLATLDRVVGILLLAGFLGFSVWGIVQPIFPLVGGVVLLVGGLWFLHLGGRMSRMAGGARDAQLVASVLLLLFPPILTAMGVYGLIVLTGVRARRAFTAGRRTLEGPKPVVARKVVRIPRTPVKDPPWVPLRLLFVASILWSLYAALALMGTSSPMAEAPLTVVRDVHQEVLQVHLRISIAGVFLSLLATGLAFRARHTRRGLGLAITALVLFVLCAGGFRNRLVPAAWPHASPSRPVPGVLHLPPPSPFRLETHR